LLDKNVRADEVVQESPDVLIVATGAKPVVPDIPGIDIDKEKVVTAYGLLSGLVKAKGRKVVVVGASQTGCETAEFLVEKGFEVTLIDRLRADEIALDAIPDHRKPLLARLSSRGVTIQTQQMLTEIKENEVVVETPQKGEKLLEAGTIVLAVGTMPVREIADRLRDRVPEVYLIGDSAGHHRIADAVYDGAIVASRI
jgi:2-enoate reductase